MHALVIHSSLDMGNLRVFLALPPSFLFLTLLRAYLIRDLTTALCR